MQQCIRYEYGRRSTLECSARTCVQIPWLHDYDAWGYESSSHKCGVFPATSGSRTRLVRYSVRKAWFMVHVCVCTLHFALCKAALDALPLPQTPVIHLQVVTRDVIGRRGLDLYRKDMLVVVGSKWVGTRSDRTVHVYGITEYITAGYYCKEVVAQPASANVHRGYMYVWCCNQRRGSGNKRCFTVAFQWLVVEICNKNTIRITRVIRRGMLHLALWWLFGATVDRA